MASSTSAAASAAAGAQPSSWTCAYAGRACGRDRVSGFSLCSVHLLEDKAAPFRQCAFHLKAHKRCHRPAPKSDRREGYCAEHSRKALLARLRTGRRRPHDPLQRCLDDLGHFKKQKAASSGTAASAAATAAASSQVDEKPQQNHVQELMNVLGAPLPSASQRALETSDVDSDSDAAMGVESLWKGGDADSDDDSVDSDMEDPLKYAGAYSAEEVIRIMRDKLIRLQKLYIDQFQRMQYLLREERRKFRHAVRKEKEDQLAPIHGQIRETPSEIATFEKIKSLNHYSRPQGLESVLYAQLLEKRARAAENSANARPASATVAAASSSSAMANTSLSGLAKCTHNLTTNTKCGEVCVPMAKFCMKHILEDTSQVLFRPCGTVTDPSDGPCETPIPDLFEFASCVYHTQLVPSVYEEKEECPTTPLVVKQEPYNHHLEAAMHQESTTVSMQMS